MSGKLVDTTLLHYFRTKLDTVFAKKSEVGDKNVIEHVQKNGTELTVTNKTVNVTVPTRTSELTNNSGFVTNDSIPTKTSQLTNDSGYITSDSIPTKTSQLTNDSGYITGGDIPTRTSQLTNDSGYITSSDVPTKTSQLTNDSDFVTSDDIPTKTSELDNDSGYITSDDVPTNTSQLTNDSNFVSDANYVHTDNNFTTQEKNKLNGIASGAEVNVQSNWGETDTSSDSFIQNKPTIPTATSQLSNDSNFVSDANYVHTDNNFTSQDKTKLGSVEQNAQVNIIEKVQQNGVDLNIENKTVNVTVPTKTSELDNDSDFITSADIPEGGIVDTALSSTSTNPVQNKAIKQETDKILGNLATIETSPSIANHAVGSYIVYNSQLYRVTTAITAGGTLDGKITAVNVGDMVSTRFNTIKDYVVEQSNGATKGYTKWNSGKLEVWERVNKTIAVTSAMSGNLKYGTLGTVTYQVPFVDYPILSATLQTQNGYGWLVPTYDNYSKTSTGTMYIYHSASQSSVKCTINIYAVGRWK